MGLCFLLYQPYYRNSTIFTHNLLQVIKPLGDIRRSTNGNERLFAFQSASALALVQRSLCAGIVTNYCRYSKAEDEAAA